jgi:hypothetical protein
VRKGEGRRLGGARPHLWRQNRAGMPADARSSDEQICRPGGGLRGEKRRGDRGGEGGFIGVTGEVLNGRNQ